MERVHRIRQYRFSKRSHVLSLRRNLLQDIEENTHLEYFPVNSSLCTHVHKHLRVSGWCDKLSDQPFVSAVGEIKGFKPLKMPMDNDALNLYLSLCESQAFVSFLALPSSCHIFICTPNTSIHSQTEGFS